MSNAHLDTALTGTTFIVGKPAVNVQRVIICDAPGADLLNVSWHPEMRGVIRHVTLTRGAQGLGVHGGDFRRGVVFDQITILDLTPAMRDGRLNGDAVDLFGASRVTITNLTCDGGYGGVKLGGGSSLNNQLIGADLRNFDSFGLTANIGGHHVQDARFVNCEVGIEARPGLSIRNCRTEKSRRCGLLATGEGVVTVVNSDLDSIEIDKGTTLCAVNTRIRRIVRNEGELVRD